MTNSVFSVKDIIKTTENMFSREEEKIQNIPFYIKIICPEKKTHILDRE